MWNNVRFLNVAANTLFVLALGLGSYMAVRILLTSPAFPFASRPIFWARCGR